MHYSVTKIIHNHSSSFAGDSRFRPVCANRRGALGQIVMFGALFDIRDHACCHAGCHTFLSTTDRGCYIVLFINEEADLSAVDPWNDRRAPS